jgi:hypothetical protein
MTVTIRLEQREVLARIPEAAFVDEMVEHVRSVPATPCGPGPHELRGWIEAVVERARRHGITHERHVWQFVKLSLRLGTGFDEEPWAREVLERRLSGATKIAVLRMHVEPPAVPEQGHEPPA